jgi:ribonuclease HIII
VINDRDAAAAIAAPVKPVTRIRNAQPGYNQPTPQPTTTKTVIPVTHSKTGSGNLKSHKMNSEKYLYSNIPEIESRVLSVLPAILQNGFILEDFKPLPYGIRLIFRKDDTGINVNLYHSKKKGHSTVFDAKIPKQFEQELRLHLTGQTDSNHISPVVAEQNFTRWIGCDEGGKGAFTGPLVVAAYLCDQDHSRDLAASGITDSKSLNGQRLMKLSHQLMNRYKNRIGLVELKPETYNRLYADFKEQGRSLNHLLAWAHGKAVEKLLKWNPAAVIVDQFAWPSFIRGRMPDVPNLIIRTKAENNIAVAAASIVAAGRYLTLLKQLSEEVGVVIQPGAGANADQSVRRAVDLHGNDILHRIVKVHFRNIDKIR